jgi:hypothetical protein
MPRRVRLHLVGRDSVEPTNFDGSAERRPTQLNRRFADGFGHRFAEAFGTPAYQCFDRENGESEPDQAESDEMLARKRFVVGEDTETKGTAGSEILQEAKSGQT